MACSGRLAGRDILLKNGRTCHEHCRQAGKYGQRRGTCGQGVASYGIYEWNRIGHSPGLSRSRLGILLNGFGKPEDVADAQAKIASDFKVRVSFSAADMSKPAAIREVIENTMQTSGRRHGKCNTRADPRGAHLQIRSVFPPMRNRSLRP